MIFCEENLLMKNSGFYFLLLCLISCTAPKDRLAKAWIYNIEPSPQQLAVNNKHGFERNEALTGANFIDLQPNGTYTSYLSSFENGKWYFKDQNLILVNAQKQIMELQVNMLTDKQMVCTDKMKKLLYNFEGQPNEFTSALQNPFSKQNNQWRLKPTHKESEAELRARLKNHFSFWEKYFAWGLKNNIDYLDVTSTPSLLKIYGNGFQLEYYENLYPEWQNCFYDTIDCRMAYEDVYYKMYQKNIQWPDSKNRFERFVSAFQQLQQWMDEKMSPYVKRKSTVATIK